MRKWLQATGHALHGKSQASTSDVAKEQAFANAYLGVVEAASASGVNLDEAVRKELDRRGIPYDSIEKDATRLGHEQA